MSTEEEQSIDESPTLREKTAVVFGAGGSIGGALARTFAAHGANIFLAGRNKASLEAVAARISDAGGRAHIGVIDALDDSAVDKYMQEVIDQSGRIDIEINATGPRAAEYGTGTPATDLPVNQLLLAQTVLTSQFITARCAARRMIPSRSGVIIFLTGSPARPHGPGTAAIGAAFAGVENLTRLMALELSSTGVRVVCLRTALNRDSRTSQDLADAIARQTGISRDQVFESLAQRTMLGASPLTEDTANGAVLLASDLSRMMTGTVHNATAGVCTD